MAIASQGANVGVDWEQRIDFPRLRRERLDRAQASLRESDLGALLLFDPNNIRYVTSTHIGEWARDKNARFTMVFRDDPPILWDFGSAARHHQLYAPWLPLESWRAGVTSMRGAMPHETGVLKHPMCVADVVDSDRHAEQPVVIRHRIARSDGWFSRPLGQDQREGGIIGRDHRLLGDERMLAVGSPHT